MYLFRYLGKTGVLSGCCVSFLMLQPASLRGTSHISNHQQRQSLSTTARPHLLQCLVKGFVIIRAVSHAHRHYEAQCYISLLCLCHIYLYKAVFRLFVSHVTPSLAAAASQHHISHITYNISNITNHISHITFYISQSQFTFHKSHITFHIS